MKKESLLSLAVASLLLISAFAPTAFNTGPTQPPVVTDTLYVGRDGWGPRNADPHVSSDTRSRELILNSYECLIQMGQPVCNPIIESEFYTYEQYWEFSPSLATNVPDRAEIQADFVNLTNVDLVDPIGIDVQTDPPTVGVDYAVVGFVNNNITDDVLGPCDVLYIMEYNASTHEIITCRTWHCRYVTIVGETVKMHLHRWYYDFNIRTDPVINFVDNETNIVDTFDINDVEYSFERALVLDPQSSGVAWMLYSVTMDAHDSYPWDTGDPNDAIILSYLIDDAFEIISTDPPVFRINVGIDFPDVAFKQIICGTWASIVSREFSISLGCWDGDLYTDAAPADGYPDWFTNIRYVEPTPYDNAWIYVGTGPYVVNSVSAVSSLVILQRNPHYWRGWPAPGKPAYLEYIDIEYISTWSTRKTAFEACQLDICDVPRAYMDELLDPTDPAKMYTILPEVKTIKNIYPFLSLDAVMFQFAVDPYSPYIGTGTLEGGAGIPPNFFNYTGVRKAFAYAFNHTEYLQEAWMGEATCRETPLISGLVPDYYTEGQDPPYKFDENSTKATIELTAAVMNATGGSAGTTASVWTWGFTLTMTCPAGNDQARIACNMIRDFFAELSSAPGRAGCPPFSISVLEVDWPTYCSEFERHLVPFCVMPWQANYADADDFMRSFMHSQGYFAYGQNYTCQNGWMTLGPRTGLTKDELIDLAVKTPDGPVRAMMYADLDDIYITDCPSFPIVQPLERKWMKYWVRGWYYNALYPSDYYYHLFKMNTCWADVTGGAEEGWPDGHCGMRCIGWIAQRFGARAPDPTGVDTYDERWAPGTYGLGGADVYGDRKVDMRDIGFACAHFLHEDEP